VVDPSGIVIGDVPGQRKVNVASQPLILQRLIPCGRFRDVLTSGSSSKGWLQDGDYVIREDHASIELRPCGDRFPLWKRGWADLRVIANVNRRANGDWSKKYPPPNLRRHGFSRISYEQGSWQFRVDDGTVKGREFYGQPSSFLYAGPIKLRFVDASLNTSNYSYNDGKEGDNRIGVVAYPFADSRFCGHLYISLTFIFGCLAMAFLYGIPYCLSSYCTHRHPVRSAFLCGLSSLLSLAASFAFGHYSFGFGGCANNRNTKNILTGFYSCNTVMGMANVLSTDKQIAVIGALAEGSSIRSIERITGVHRDTVMRLGVRVGKGCAALMDAKMRDLGCRYLEFDEIWGFIGKKEKNLTVDDGPECGDAWTFCAVDADTKLVPAFKVGKRDGATANAFVQDVASRMKNRVQISTDGLRAYVEAIEKAFGTDVDYAQIVKTYIHDESGHPNRRYSAPDIVSTEKKWFAGRPDMRHVSTSYVERLNATTRLHMRRLTRLTLAFSKKRENFEAAVALHFAYYNFVKRHNTLRCTPAMAAGVERGFWSIGDLLEAAS